MGDNGYGVNSRPLTLEGLSVFSTYALGLLGVLAGCFWFGLDWVASAFLFFPIYGLACGLVNNESRRMVCHAVSLLFFPVAVLGTAPLVASALAAMSGKGMTVAPAADVFGKHVGESERNVRKLFSDIRKNPLSVVFIDELETLFPKRTEEVHETTRKVISLLLQELDGIDKSKNPILLLGATNVPWMIDEAFLRPGRFDVKVFVGLPDFDARRQMLIAAFDRRLTLYTYDFADEILAGSSTTTNADMIARIRAWEKSAC